MLKIGARNVLNYQPSGHASFHQGVGKHDFSVLTGVNTLFNALLNQSAFQGFRFQCLKNDHWEVAWQFRNLWHWSGRRLRA